MPKMRTVRRLWFFIRMLLVYLRFKVKQSLRKSSETNIVQTKYGPVRGVKRTSCWRESYYSYERIPFARPPLKELRFKDPIAPYSWEKPLDCTNEASIPRQMHILFKKLEGSEDCLYLNVYTNNPNPAQPRPVMVWIYGGGFETGSTSKDLYSPDYIMPENVVLVSIAYRVSIFGFLSLKDPNLGIPGNAGLKDQIMGLKWVRDNICNFGGDPNNVTMFGESAGGASVHYLLLSDQAKGLFHKAIIMSGSVFSPWALLPPNDWPHRIAKNMGFTGPYVDKDVLDFFMKADSKDLARNESKALNKEEVRNRILFPSGPVIEPYASKNCVIPKDPKLMARNAWGNDIPMIIGGNSYEGLFVYPDVRRNPSIIDKIEDCEYLVPLELGLDRNSAECKELGLRLKQAFFQDKAPSLYPYLNLLSYKFFWHGIHRTLLSRTKYASASTFLYRFDFDSPTFNHVRILCCGKHSKGVSHADDLSYLFFNAVADDLSQSSPEYRTIKRLVGMWAQFARTSNPNIEDVTSNSWLPIRCDQRPFKCLNISYNVEYADLPESGNLKVWDSLYEKFELI